MFGLVTVAIVGFAAPTPVPAADETKPVAARVPWIRRWAPSAPMFHLGVFGGAFFPARDVELFEVDQDARDQGFLPYERVAPELGARFAVFPFDFLGIELEGSFAFGEVDTGERAGLWSARGHLLGQIPRWSVTPFVLAGAGALGVQSDAVGRDVDLGIHFGGGLMVHLTRGFTIRADVRNTVSPQQGPSGGATNSPAVLLGLGWTRRPRASREAPEPNPSPVPEAPPPADTDGDGFVDDEDACPNEPGIAPDGCADPDPDGDGVVRDDDACPDVAGGLPDGCPEPAVVDTDGDGFADDVEACPSEPETFNAYRDDDGCPDDVPPDLTALEGALQGVEFNVDSARLQGSSKARLDAVVDVLRRHPDVGVEISGHTDSTGSVEHNHTLSEARAEAVKSYFVEQGIEGERVSTRGAGSDEPIDTNATPAGRARNRRIEFRLRE